MTMAKSLISPSKGAQASDARFNPSRLTFARNRRGLKKTDLAKHIGITPRSVTGYECGDFPPETDRLAQIASFLKFPPSFFYEEELLETIDANAVSFRSMTKMSAALRNVALGAGSLAIQLNSWLESRFVLPELDLPDFGRDMAPDAAAEALRQHWGLGEQPVRNMVHLLEAKGIRVYSLAIDAKEVDAFSTWWNGKPFVFLNTQKTAEHSRFDAAHELGHLVLHRHGEPHGQDAEKDANTFASAFLMPARSVIATQLRFPTLDSLIRAKKHWAVSVAALNYRLHTLGMTTEWVNRSLCIEIARAGFRTNEPNSIPRETSQILEKVFYALKQEGLGKGEIANSLHLTSHEIDELTYGLLRLGAVPDRVGLESPHSESVTIARNRSVPRLTVVK